MSLHCNSQLCSKLKLNLIRRTFDPPKTLDLLFHQELFFKAINPFNYLAKAFGVLFLKNHTFY